jgi:hypothetical protein
MEKKKKSSNPPIRYVPLSINSGDASRASEFTCTHAEAQVLALANKTDYGKEKKKKRKH